VEEKGF